MIRIVGLQRSESVEGEFLLLQNHGNLRAVLRGHVVASADALAAGDLSIAAHAFSEEEAIPPGMYVMLATGSGTPAWKRSKDGALVFFAYMGRTEPVWSRSEGPIQVLATQHTYSPRTSDHLVLR